MKALVDKKMSAWKRSFTSTDWKCQQSALHPSSLPFIPEPCFWSGFEGGFISPLVFSIPATIIIGEVYENESTSLRNCRDRAIRQFLLKNAPGQQVHNFLLQYISAPIIFAIFQSLPMPPSNQLNLVSCTLNQQKQQSWFLMLRLSICQLFLSFIFQTNKV